MILSHPTFEKAIQFDEVFINVLVVENQKQFSSYLNELYQQTKGEEGSFRAYTDLYKIGFEKIRLILSPVELDINSREIVNAVVRGLSKCALDEDHYLDTNSHLNELTKYVNKLSVDCDSEFIIDDFTIDLLLKVVDLKFEDDCGNIVERIINYIHCCKRYLMTKLFIFVNLKSFLNDSDLSSFYDYVSYEKIDVLLIESTCRDFCEKERVTIIDGDLCEIHSIDS